jgi:hypothetical protein
LETSQEQQNQALRKKLICPTCKIIYEHGEVCIKCESALVPQTSAQTNGEPKPSSESEIEEEPLHVQTFQEQLAETSRKKLICPACKIIYERGDSCVRCGAALVPQTPSKEKEKPKSSDIESNPPPSESDGLEDLFLRRASTEPSEASDQGPRAAPKQSSLSLPSPKGQDSGVPERGKKREFRAVPASELSLEEEFLQAQTPEQPVARKSADDLLKGVTFLSKLKKDYRRLGMEVGSIMVMVLALWSIYSYFTKKNPEPGTPISKNVAVQTLPSPSPAPPPATPVAESGKPRNAEGSLPISKETPPAPPSLPDTSGAPSTEIREIGNIKIVLENIRRANLQEDIDLFLYCYASDFRNREEKRKAILANWKIFNYHDLSYALKKTSISDNTAKARVEWVIKTSSKGGGGLQENKSIWDVTFKKEEGRWKIEELTPAK